MTSSDPLDNKIREALGDVVSHASLAPDFDDLEPPAPARRRVGLAAAAALAIVAAIGTSIVVLGGDDAQLVTGGEDRSPGEADPAAGACEERVASFRDSGVDLLVYLRPDAGPGEWQRMTDELLSRIEVEDGRFVDQDATYEEFADLFADRPQIVESVTPEILPPRVELGLREPGSAKTVAASILDPAVREVMTLEEMLASAESSCRMHEATTSTVPAAAPPPSEPPAGEVPADEAPADEPPADEPSSAGEWTADALGEGSWTGARTSDDGRELLVTFIGGRPYDADDPCSVDYRAEVNEGDGSVEVRILAQSPRPPGAELACSDEGYLRTVTVRLSSPLGDRAVVDRQFARTRPVFDGSSLAEPTWLPEGWTLREEGPGHPDPDSVTSWRRSWAGEPPPPTETHCTPSEAGITLTQGPPDLVERYPDNGERPVSTHEVHGAEATYAEDETRTFVRLSWVVDGQAYVVASMPACVGDEVPSLDTLLRFADGLAL